jgi:transcriptional regulator with XRE-family HTH domain
LITNLQIRAARALLGWSQQRLADEAGVSVITVKRLEAQEEDFRARYDIVMKVKGAVEQAGVEFLGEGFSHGVQLKPRLGPIDIQDSHV